MNKISYKARVGIGVGLILLSVVALIATIVWGAYRGPIWALISIPIIALLMFAIGIVFVPKTNEDGTQIVLEKKTKIKKPKKYKPKKQKKPFMTEEEWKEQEKEDDKMMFIEEVVEDD